MKRGFTLIELLVVIAIIGVLASIVLAALTSAREDAKYSAAQSELQQIEKAIVIGQGETRRTLMQITGSGCSDCACRGGNNIQSATCYANWTRALGRIQTAAAVVEGLTAADRDPWGQPYLIDENEGEVPTAICRQDTLRTAGPDGAFGTPDDYVRLLPFTLPQCR